MRPSKSSAIEEGSISSSHDRMSVTLANLASRIRLIPEGGWGWVICAAAFVTQLIVMGINNSFGILFTTLLDVYKKSKAETAWVGSVSIGVMYLFGPITSGLSERYGCRVVAFLGGLLCSLGMLLTSFVTDLPKLYVTYGVLWGVGSSFCYFPTLTAPGEYFCNRLSLVNGIVTAGSGIGTLTFGPILQHILQRYGLATSLRILSCVTVVLMVTALAYKQHRSPLEELFEVKRQQGPFFDMTIWQNKAFCVYTGAISVFMLGYFIPYVHLVSHVEGIGISPSKAALLVGFMSIASTISRFVFGKFSDHPKVNRLFMTQMAITGFGVTTTLCPLARSYSSLVTVVVILGLFEGLYVVLIAVLNTDIVGVHKLPTALGSLYGVISLTLTLGPPFAGMIFDMLHSYHTAFYICGATTTLSACIMFLIPWLVPNQQDGVFRRDSEQSRLESLFSSRPSTPRMSQMPRRFIASSSLKSCSSGGSGPRSSEDDKGDSSLCETDRVELEYFKTFADGAHSDEDDDGENSSFSKLNSLSFDTSINTVFNSTMSHRGSITKFLLQQQPQSHTSRGSSSPLSDSFRGLGLGSSPSRGGSSRSSMSSYFGGSKTMSFSNPTKSRDSRRGSNSVLGRDLNEPSFEDSSGLNSSEVEPEIEEPSTLLLSESRKNSGTSTVVGSRLDSGQSTVVCSNRSSVIREVGSRKISQASHSQQCAQYRSAKDPDMLHVLAARLLQAAGERNDGMDGIGMKESVV